MKWDIWTQLPKESLGLDISPHAITMIYLTSQAKQVNIQQILQVTRPVGTETNAFQLVTERIKETVSMLKTPYRVINTALSDHLCFTQSFNIETTQPDWKAMSIRMAADSLLNSLDTLYFDFQKLKTADTTTQVLGVFCQKNTVQEHLHWIKQSGLKTQNIELRSHALERAFRYLYHLNQYPDCWVSVLLEATQYIILLWKNQYVVSSVIDSIEETEMPSLITRLYSCIVCLLGQQPSDHQIQGLWVVGDAIHTKEIECRCRALLGLQNHPTHQYQDKINKNHADSLASYLVALGLALRTHKSPSP